jgi:hypothetical protein
MQSERINQKSSEENLFFQISKHVFFFHFSLFGPFLLSNLITFLFLVDLKWFKILLEHHLKFYKSYSNSNTATYKENFECSGIDLCIVQWFVFLSLDPLLKDCNFLIFNLVLTIASMSDAPRREVQVLLGHQKQQSPPLWSGLPWALKCLVTSWSTLGLSE